MRHILSSQQFDRPFLEALFREARRFKQAFREDAATRAIPHQLAGEVMVTLFYEPSTRTRLSFEAAAVHLGMDVISTENAREFSSAIKGETLEDTIRVVSSYHPDVIVLRHFETGAAERAARVSSVPIINAGDGMGQHPTQALLDIFTIAEEQRRIDGLTVVIGGDLAHGRTARSLAYLLGKFRDVEITFISPPELRIGEDIKEYLSRHGIRFHETASMHPALYTANIVYWTRIQQERMSPALYEKVRDAYTITPPEISEMRSDTAILHPLPRLNEILPGVDADPRAAYFRQAQNGLYVRMALLSWVLE